MSRDVGFYKRIFKIYKENKCIEPTICMNFYINDTRGNGLSLGYYEVAYDGEVVASSGFKKGGSSYFMEVSDFFGQPYPLLYPDCVL